MLGVVFVLDILQSGVISTVEHLLVVGLVDVSLVEVGAASRR